MAKKSDRSRLDTFKKSRALEASYSRQLAAVAKQIGSLVQGFDAEGVLADDNQVLTALGKYSELLQPWANSVASRLVAQLEQEDQRAWNSLSKYMSEGVRDRILVGTPNFVLKNIRDRQVSLITSLPIEAADRVHKLAMEAQYTGARAESLVKEIMASGAVSRSRAMTIARTEVSGANTALTQTRAESVGSEGYIWRTSEDTDVRKSHKDMAGRFVRWDKPPTLDNMTGHAGQFPNCRCYPEPVIPGFE